jgi:hypothetical protein
MLYSHITPFTMACHNANIATLQFHSHQQKKTQFSKITKWKKSLYWYWAKSWSSQNECSFTHGSLIYTPLLKLYRGNCTQRKCLLACLRTMCNLPFPPKTPCTPECRDASLGTLMTSEKTHIERNTDDLQCNTIFAAWNKHVIWFEPEDNFSINQTIVDCSRTSTRNKEKSIQQQTNNYWCSLLCTNPSSP